MDTKRPSNESDEKSKAGRIAVEKQGLRVSARLARILAALAVWLAFGAAIFLIGAEQYLFGGILIAGDLALIVLAIEGSRMKERTLTRLDLALQWTTLILPFGLVIPIVVVVGLYFRPFLGYFLSYLAVLTVIVALAAYELRRGVRVG